jgi:hypothetical protein
MALRELALFAGVGGGFLGVDCLAGARSAGWSWSRTAGKCCCGDSGTVCWTCSRSGTTCERLTVERGVERWISSLRGSRASRSVLLGRSVEGRTSGTGGRTRSGSFARWDRGLRCWRTSQGCLFTNTLERFSGTWPRRGLMRNGVCWERTMLAPRTGGSGCGSWPTPMRADARGSAGVGKNELPNAVKAWPTPNTADANRKGADIARRTRAGSGGDDLVTAVRTGGGATPQKIPPLNPSWVEWLMGWPIEWTALEPLEMGRYRRWLEQHGGC